jgi:hypothetical protein
MKAIFVAASFSILAAAFAQDLAPELAPIQMRYKADVAELDSKREAVQSAAGETYAAALDAAERAASKAGSVQGVATIVGERGALKAGTVQPKATVELPKSVAAARKTYVDAVARITKETRAKRAVLNSNYLKALASLEPRAAQNPELARQIVMEKETLLGVGLVGKWHFANRGEGNFEVVIADDGTCVVNNGQDRGEWKIEDGFVVLYWGNGVKSRLSLAGSTNTRTGDTMLRGRSNWIPNIKATRMK